MCVCVLARLVRTTLIGLQQLIPAGVPSHGESADLTRSLGLLLPPPAGGLQLGESAGLYHSLVLRHVS